MNKYGFLFLGLFLGILIMLPLTLRQTENTLRNYQPSYSQTSVSMSSVSSIALNMAHVIRAVDGDTLAVTMSDGKEERVRFIGINAPESVDPKKAVECYGKEASVKMRALLDGKDVTLIPEEKDDRDVYGRLLRYVSLGSIDIGAKMISEGYAESYCYKYPHPRCSEYEALERAAVSAGVGKWGSCK